MGSRVLAETMKLDGVAIRPGDDYRVTVNSFMASGGDGFTALKGGRDAVTGVIDVDAGVAYFAAKSPVAPPSARRVSNVAR